jgi:hypothetical protein
MKIVWRTSDDHAFDAPRHIAERLPEGYRGLTPPHARLVSMTEPAGMSDLDS